MKCRVVKAFRDIDDRMKHIGDIIDVDGHRLGKLLQYRLVAIEKEKAIKKVEVEKATVELKHIGGGYYELPDGRKIHGKEKARKEMNK
jgi:hypothetical protein